MKSGLLATLLLATLASPAGAATVAKTYSYFWIGGSTLEEIQRQLDVRRPKVKTTGHRHPGATQMEFAGRVAYAPTGDSCKVAKAAVTVKARIILPRWRRPGRAEADVALIWDTLASDIKRHEESHVVIAKNHARELEQALLAIGKQPDCKTAQARAKDVSQKILARHDRAQVEFDRVEGINFERRSSGCCATAWSGSPTVNCRARPAVVDDAGCVLRGPFSLPLPRRGSARPARIEARCSSCAACRRRAAPGRKRSASRSLHRLAEHAGEHAGHGQVDRSQPDCRRIRRAADAARCCARPAKSEPPGDRR